MGQDWLCEFITQFATASMNSPFHLPVRLQESVMHTSGLRPPRPVLVQGERVSPGLSA